MASAALALTKGEGSLKSNIIAMHTEEKYFIVMCTKAIIPSQTCSFEMILDFSDGKFPSM